MREGTRAFEINTGRTFTVVSEKEYLEKTGRGLRTNRIAYRYDDYRTNGIRGNDGETYNAWDAEYLASIKPTDMGIEFTVRDERGYCGGCSQMRAAGNDYLCRACRNVP